MFSSSETDRSLPSASSFKIRNLLLLPIARRIVVTWIVHSNSGGLAMVISCLSNLQQDDTIKVLAEA